MLLCLSILSILTSRMMVFLAISSSSDSLNFLIATANNQRIELTELSGFLVFSFVDDSVGPLANDADDFILVHYLSN